MDIFIEQIIKEKFGEQIPLDKFDIVEFKDDWIISPKFDLNEDEIAPAGAIIKVLVIDKFNLSSFFLGHFCFCHPEEGIDWFYTLKFKNLGNSVAKMAQLLSLWLPISSVEILKELKQSFSLNNPYFIRHPLKLKKELETLGAVVAFIRPNNQGIYH